MLNGKFFFSNNRHQPEKRTQSFKLQQRINQLGISSGSIFHLFSYEINQGHIHNSGGKIPSPRLLMTALRQCYCWEKLDEGHYRGIKLGFQNKRHPIQDAKINSKIFILFKTHDLKNHTTFSGS